MARKTGMQGRGPLGPGLVVGICVAVGVVTAVLAVYLFAFRRFTTSWGEQIKRNERYVWIDGETLTQKDLEQIAAIGTLRSLSLRNCNVAECRLPELKFASKHLNDLRLSGTKGLWDLSFLSSVPAEYVDLSDCPGVDDISMLNWDVLRDLDVSGTEVSDLSPAAGTEISELLFARTDVSDLTPLASAPELWEVNGSYTKVTSLDALSELEHLWRINFDGCPIREIKQPIATDRLYDVSLCDTRVRDLSGLAGCTRLNTLRLGGCGRVRDLSWLNEGNYETLTELDLGGTRLTAPDIAWVARCGNLERLSLDGIELGNLGFCRRLPLLTSLSCMDCGISSISGIEGCTELSTIILGHNQIEDIVGLPAPSGEWPETMLDLSHNQLTSVKDLPTGEYRAIFLQGNTAEIGRTVGPGVKSYCVVTPWFRGIEDSRLGNHERFDYLYLLDCPEDESDRLRSTIMSWRFKPVSEDEMLQLLADGELFYTSSFDTQRYAAYARELLQDAS